MKNSQSRTDPVLNAPTHADPGHETSGIALLQAAHWRARTLAKLWREGPDAVLQEAGYELDKALDL